MAKQKIKPTKSKQLRAKDFIEIADIYSAIDALIPDLPSVYYGADKNPMTEVEHEIMSVVSGFHGRLVVEFDAKKLKNYLLKNRPNQGMNKNEK